MYSILCKLPFGKIHLFFCFANFNKHLWLDNTTFKILCFIKPPKFPHVSIKTISAHIHNPSLPPSFSQCLIINLSP